MARRLKSYQTSSGFFDLAVAAPSMKAAAEAWGSRTNVFQQGLAKETHDPAIVAATMAKPGVVLRRPVGSSGSFTEQAQLPKHLPVGKITEPPAKRRPKRKEPAARKTDEKASRAAALAFEREQKRREAARHREQVALEKELKRRERAIAKAEKALEKAEREHDARVKQIERDLAAVERRSQSEYARWEKQKEKLQDALRRARD